MGDWKEPHGASELDKFKEGNRLEAKLAQGGLPGSLWETVSAFANTSGGRIVLGVKESNDGSFELVGLKDARKMLDDFWNAALSKDKLSARSWETRMPGSRPSMARTSS